MANFIPAEKISEIINRADILEIISEVVVLKKSGKNYIGLCPFHSEKTPSFTVSQEKQLFHCFGCGVGGNVFKFIKKQQGLTFPEAARMLSRRYNVALPTQKMTPDQKKAIKEREKLFEVNRLAMEFYQEILTNSKEGQHARRYFEKREMTEEIINNFMLGYAPAKWDSLAKFLSSRHISPAISQKAGLIIPRKNTTSFYDRFRNRVVFPIFDTSKGVVGFGGRVMDDLLPKYVNTPETPIYNKRRYLYGLHRARQKCQEKGAAYIVEGYFDVLSLHKHGIENTVATLGTAFTLDHLRLIQRAAQRIILIFDSDNAGMKAAKRTCEVFLNEDVDARIMVLPSGHDPDSFIRDKGHKSFADFATRAQSVVSFLIDSAITQHGNSIEGKIRTISALKTTVASLPDPVARALYIKELAERVGIGEAVVQERIMGSPAKEISPNLPRMQHKQLTIKRSPVNRTLKAKDDNIIGEEKESKLEREIIAMMLQFPEIFEEIEKREILELFENNSLKAIGTLLLEQKEKTDGKVEKIKPSQLTDNNKLQRMVAYLTIKENSYDKKGCLRLISQFQASRVRKDKSLLRKIKAAENNNDQDLLIKLLRDTQLKAQKI